MSNYEYRTRNDTYSGLSLTGWSERTNRGAFYTMPDGTEYYQNTQGTYRLVKVNDIGGEPEPATKERKVSTVEICDRCGAIGKDEVMSGLDLTTPGERALDFGLCSMCRVDFDTWMMEGSNLRAGTSVTKKYVNEPKISEETRMLARVVAEEFARARDNASKQITNGD